MEKITILIADDHKLIRETWSYILNSDPRFEVVAECGDAEEAVELAKQSLDAEQKKYALGASTSTLVLQNQSALATAESNLVSAMAAYEKAQIELDRATGLLLEHAGINLSDAERGEVTHMPKVPYVTPRTDVQSVMPQQPPSQQ